VEAITRNSDGAVTLHLVERSSGTRPPVRLTFTLPYPPTTNNLFAGAFGGRRLSVTARAYVKRVAELALMNAQHMPRFVLTGRIGIALVASPPDARDRDLDNLLKAPLDALKKCGVLRDDCDIDDIHIRRGSIIPGGRLEVTLWQL
jgi:crossover junction endodeoxyribonuclease RusA